MGSAALGGFRGSRGSLVQAAGLEGPGRRSSSSTSRAPASSFVVWSLGAPCSGTPGSDGTQPGGGTEATRGRGRAGMGLRSVLFPQPPRRPSSERLGQSHLRSKSLGSPHSHSQPLHLLALLAHSLVPAGLRVPRQPSREGAGRPKPQSPRGRPRHVCPTQPTLPASPRPGTRRSCSGRGAVQPHPGTQASTLLARGGGAASSAACTVPHDSRMCWPGEGPLPSQPGTPAPQPQVWQSPWAWDQVLGRGKRNWFGLRRRAQQSALDIPFPHSLAFQSVQGDTPTPRAAGGCGRTLGTQQGLRGGERPVSLRLPAGPRHLGRKKGSAQSRGVAPPPRS